MKLILSATDLHRHLSNTLPFLFIYSYSERKKTISSPKRVSDFATIDGPNITLNIDLQNLKGQMFHAKKGKIIIF